MGHRGRFSGNKILESRCGSFSSERLRSWMQKSRFYLIYLSTSPISHLNAAQGRKVQFLWVIMVLGKFSLYQTQIWSLPTHVTNWLYLVLTDALETWMTWLYINTFMATTVVFYRAGVYWNYMYCQNYPAIWGVISNTLPLWKKECQYTDSSQDELENTPSNAICTSRPSRLPMGFVFGQSRASGCKLPQGRIFQYIS